MLYAAQFENLEQALKKINEQSETIIELNIEIGILKNQIGEEDEESINLLNEEIKKLHSEITTLRKCTIFSDKKIVIFFDAISKLLYENLKPKPKQKPKKRNFITIIRKMFNKRHSWTK